MRAAAGSDSAGREGSATGAEHLARFIVVGLGATLVYALCALLLAAVMRPSAASVLAYAVAAVFSYLGHKFFTFMSDGAHRVEAPRFLALTLCGLGVSFVIPELVSGLFGLPVAVAVGLTCVLVPIVNYVVLRLWVFSSDGEAGR